MFRFTPAVLTLSIALGLTSCLEPTQVTFNITTDVPCEKINGTSITVGLSGQTEKATPVAVVRECRTDGTVGILGTYAIVPKSDRQLTAAVKVAVAVGSDVDVEADCVADKNYQGCIVARRQVNFIARRQLVVPIDMYLVCRNVACDEGSTCNRAARCVTNKVDTTTCTADNTCPSLVTEPGQGLPCFNTTDNTPLFCKGDASWCTRDSSGQRACSELPGSTGVSFECRKDSDCGVGLSCLEGGRGVLGQCFPTISAGPSLSLREVTITDTSPTNHSMLRVTYQGLTGTPAEYCVLENTSALGACNWVTGATLPSEISITATSGPVVLGVYLKDSKGRLSDLAVSNEIVVDRVAPQATWVSPVGGEVWPGNSTQTLQWAASDNVSLAAMPIGLEVSPDDGMSWQTIASSVGGTSYEWATGNINSGHVRLRLTVTDSAGNVSTVTTSPFTIGTPSLALSGVTVNNGAGVTNNATLSLTWGTTDAPFTQYCINVNDALLSRCTWVTASTLPTTTVVMPPDGNKTLTVWLRNAVGDVSAPVSSNVIYLDQTAPIAAFTSPLGGEIWANTPHNITWAVSDGYSLAVTPISLEVSIDDGLTFAALAGPLANMPASWPWLPSNVNSATVKLRLSASDSAGNVTTITSPALTLDSVAPGVASLIVNSGGPLTRFPALNLTWGNTSGTFTRYCVNVNSALVADCMWANAPLPQTLTVASVDGNKTLTAWLMDAAGNVSAPVTANTVYLDVTPPVLTWAVPTGGETWQTGTSRTLRWSISDNHDLGPGTVSVAYSTDLNHAQWAAIGTVDKAAPQTLGWVTPQLLSTHAQLRAGVVDAAGNQSIVMTGEFSLVEAPTTLASVTFNNGVPETNIRQIPVSFGAASPYTRYCVNVNDTAIANCTWVTGTLPTTVNLPLVSDGNKTLTVWLEGPLGGRSAPVTSNTVFFDTTAPTIAWTNIVNGAFWSAGAPHTLTWAASDNHGLAATPITISFSTNAALTWTDVTEEPVANTPSSYVWTVPSIGNGTPALRVTATDLAGNSASAVYGGFSISDLLWSPLVRNYGSINVHTVSDHFDFTLTNNSNNTASGCSAVTLSNTTDFKIVADGCGTSNLASTEACVVTVRSNRSGLGAETATLNRSCSTGGTAEPPVLTVTGTGTLPTRWNTSSTTDFGEVRVGRSSYPAKLQFQNMGLVSASSCDAPTLSNTVDFTLVSETCGTTNVPPGGQCEVTVRANPATAGLKITVLSRDCRGVTRTATLQATGIAAAPVSIAGGSEDTFAVMSDGTVRGWGVNAYGSLGASGATSFVPIAVTGITSAAAVYGGLSHHNCARLSDGTAKCWGNNGYGQVGDGSAINRDVAVPVSGLSGVSSMSLGAEHSCALLNDGSVKCWGRNIEGELGTGDTTNTSVPVSVPSLSGVTSLGLGMYHSCAVLTDTTVRCWGSNGSGQLGSTGPTALSPIAVPSLSGVVALSGGQNHTCALMNDATVRCWGLNYQGQLGQGTTANYSGPQVVAGLTGVTRLASGWSHTCARLSNQTVKCWGANTMGQIGDGSAVDRLSPVAVTGLTGVTDVSASGAVKTCALLTDQSVQCWGSNSYHDWFGNLGDGEGSVRRSVVKRTEAQAMLGVSTSLSHTCVLMADRTVRCLGDNSQGALGSPSLFTQATFNTVSGVSNASSVTTGHRFSCALNQAGYVQCWGRNNSGELGNGTTVDSTSPVLVQSFVNATQLSTGLYHSCVVLSGGTARCWGNNSDGQLGDNSIINRSTPVFVQTMSQFSAIAAGTRFTCGLFTDQTVSCWGLNDVNQLGDGSGINRRTPSPITLPFTGAVAIAAGGQHACAVLSNGLVKCWGSNQYGALGDGTRTTRTSIVDVRMLSGAVGITVGDETSCARLSDGSVQCWGFNYYGQLGQGSTAGTINLPTVVPGVGAVTSLGMPSSSSNTPCFIGTPATDLYCTGDNYFSQTTESQLLRRTVSGF